MAVKSAKKAAGAVRMPRQAAKKAAPGGADRRITVLGKRIDEAIRLMTVSIAESNARADASIAESNARTDARIAESDAKTEASFAKTEASIAELARFTKDLAKSGEETRREMRQITADLAKSDEEMRREMRQTTLEMRQITADLAESIDRANRNVGGLNRSIGMVVEMVVLPGLMEAMNAQCGYQFDILSSDRIFRDNGRQYAEVDLFLENGVSVMAVEAKTRVRRGELNDFVETLEKLRKHEIKAGLVGKTIYAAVAGITFDTNAEAFAKEKGMFLVKLNQNNSNIKIEPPEGEVGKW